MNDLKQKALESTKTIMGIDRDEFLSMKNFTEDYTDPLKKILLEDNRTKKANEIILAVQNIGNRPDIAEAQQKQLSEVLKLIEALETSKAALEFYAEPTNWDDQQFNAELSEDQNIDAVSMNTPWHEPCMCAGKLAREALSKIEELLK